MVDKTQERKHLSVKRALDSLPWYCTECGKEFNTEKQLKEHGGKK